MAKENKKAALSMEERLDAALVPDWEQPYKVPANWCWTTVGAINKYVGSSVDPLVNPDTIFELYSVPSSVEDYPEIVKGAEIGSTKQRVKKGDVLLCKINPRINRVWRVSQHTQYLSIASSEWIVVRNEAISSHYLMWYMRSEAFRDYMLSNVSGVGGSLMRAQPKYVQGYPVPLPPLAEQQRIVDRIESLFAKLDEAKEKAQAVVDGYDARRAAILHKAFTGELTEKWRSVRGVKTDSWLNTDLSHSVLSFKYGTSEKSAYENTGMPVFRIPNVTDLGLSFEDLKYLPHDDIPYESQIHENEILIIRSNGSRDLVGKSVLVPHLDQQYAYASFLIKAVPAKMIDPAFLVYYLNSADARNQMFKKAKSTAGINNINSKELGEITISIPPLQEQAEIVSILGKLLEGEMQTVETAKKAVGKIEQMKKAILARAFRGKLGTNDPTDEIAEELLMRVL